jgi:hypothetical protein
MASTLSPLKNFYHSIRAGNILQMFGETRGPARVALDQAIPSGIDRERFGSLQTPVGLAPAIFINRIGNAIRRTGPNRPIG